MKKKDGVMKELKILERIGLSFKSKGENEDKLLLFSEQEEDIRV